MMAREYGSKWTPGEYQSASDIAKLMRSDIKVAIVGGELPGSARNYSVRVDNFAGNSSIDIEARDLHGMWQDCADSTCRRYEHDQGGTHRTLTVEGKRITTVLQGIHNDYNYDGSDVLTDYFDVNFYGSAKVEDEWHANFRRREAERKAARKAAQKAGLPR